MKFEFMEYMKRISSSLKKVAELGGPSRTGIEQQPNKKKSPNESILENQRFIPCRSRNWEATNRPNPNWILCPFWLALLCCSISCIEGARARSEKKSFENLQNPANSPDQMDTSLTPFDSPQEKLTEPQATLAIDDRISIVVEVSGLANDKGECLVALYTDRTSFNQVDLAAEKGLVSIENGRAEYTFSIEKGTIESFAVAAFHDENGNGVLDRNRLGIPTERYGFSNNARGSFGPPSFESAAVRINNPTNESRILIEINVQGLLD